MGKGDQLDLTICKQGRQIRRVQVARLWINAPFTNVDTRIGQTPPTAAIGFMILIGDNNRITVRHAGPQGMGQDIGIQRG